MHKESCGVGETDRDGVSVGFSGGITEVMRAHQFERDSKFMAAANKIVCRAVGSLTPARSACGLPVYVTRLPPAPFCKTPFEDGIRRGRLKIQPLLTAESVRDV